MGPIWIGFLLYFCLLFAFVFLLGCVFLCSLSPCTFEGWVPVLDFYIHGFSSFWRSLFKPWPKKCTLINTGSTSDNFSPRNREGGKLWISKGISPFFILSCRIAGSFIIKTWVFIHYPATLHPEQGLQALCRVTAGEPGVSEITVREVGSMEFSK